MSKTRRAVFLDRDGVINKERSDYVKNKDELEIFPDATDAIIQIKSHGFLVVVITNQSAVNRGLTNHYNIDEIHLAIQNHLSKYGTSIDAFYYCPHRPDENCDCRKPKPGLLLRASKELEIDLASSWMIGDNDSDVIAANSVGCKALKIGPNFVIQNAVKSILKSE